MADALFLPPNYALRCNFWGGATCHLLFSPPRREERSEKRGNRGSSMTRKRVEELRCSNGENCVAYPALGAPSKLARGNPGTRCFACEERRVASKLKATAAKEEVVERMEANEPRSGKSGGPQEHTEVGRAYEVLQRRRRSVLTCERGLHAALGSGDERLVRRWSRLLREAEARLAWAEADLARAEKWSRSERAR